MSMHPEVAVNTPCQRLSGKPACQLQGCDFLSASLEMQGSVVSHTFLEAHGDWLHIVSQSCLKIGREGGEMSNTTAKPGHTFNNPEQQYYS